MTHIKQPINFSFFLLILSAVVFNEVASMQNSILLAFIEHLLCNRLCFRF